MPDEEEAFRPATEQDVAQTLAFALTHTGRKANRDAAPLMAQVVAERLVQHLTRSGYVILKKPPVRMATANYDHRIPMKE